MIAELAPCFEGPFAHWRDVVALDAETGDDSLAGASLLEPEVAKDLVARFGATYPGADRRSVVSMWSQWYFGSLVIPAAAAFLLLGRALPVALGDTRVAFTPDGRPRRFVLRDAGAATPMPAEPLSALIDGHVTPLIERIAPLFRVSPRLLWCNVATVLDWTLREVGRDAPPERQAEGRRALEAPYAPCGTRNCLCGLVGECHGQAGLEPQRRVCCLRYLLPGVPGCGSLCPLPEISGRNNS